MITINVGNLNSKITGLLDWNINKVLDKSLSYQVEGVEFIPAVIEGRWDGIVHLYNIRTQMFSTGLLDKVCELLQQYNLQFNINDTRVKPAQQIPIPTNTVLRKDQEDVVNNLIGKVRGIAALPTGWG